jgi:hypothetical protein
MVPLRGGSTSITGLLPTIVNRKGDEENTSESQK